MKILKTNNIGSFLKKIAFRNKYDLFANEAARDIFFVIKNNYLSKNTIQESFEYEDAKYIVDLVFSHDNLVNRKFDIMAGFNTNDKNSKTPAHIVIKVVLDYSFLEENFEELNYYIYEFIRHEYEHFCSCDKDIEPNKEYYDNLSAMQEEIPLIDRARLVEKNVLDSYEIDAYAKSIMYTAKKRKVRFQNVLHEALDIMFFGFSKENQELGCKDAGIMKIYLNIFDKLKERIHKIFNIKQTAINSTKGFFNLEKKSFLG